MLTDIRGHAPTGGGKTRSNRSCGRRGEQRPSLVDIFWPAEDAAAAVRSRFQRTNWQARVVDYRPVEVAADGSDLVVVFRFVGYAELFAVRFSLSRMPEGPQTGEMCESLDAWAEEVDWVLDEELNTLHGADRRASDGGRRGGDPSMEKPVRHSLSAPLDRCGQPAHRHGRMFNRRRQAAE